MGHGTVKGVVYRCYALERERGNGQADRARKSERWYERERERQTDRKRQTNTHTDRQKQINTRTERKSNDHGDRVGEGQTGGHNDREADKQTNTKI